MELLSTFKVKTLYNFEFLVIFIFIHLRYFPWQNINFYKAIQWLSTSQIILHACEMLQSLRELIYVLTATLVIFYWLCFLHILTLFLFMNFEYGMEISKNMLTIILMFCVQTIPSNSKERACGYKHQQSIILTPHVLISLLGCVVVNHFQDHNEVLIYILKFNRMIVWEEKTKVVLIIFLINCTNKFITHRLTSVSRESWWTSPDFVVRRL